AAPQDVVITRASLVPGAPRATSDEPAGEAGIIVAGRRSRSRAGAPLRLEAAQRRRLWRRLMHVVERYADDVGDERVAPRFDPQAIRERLRPFDFNHLLDPELALAIVARQMRTFQTHAAHPRYFGLFNPAPTTMGIVADALVAAFNP